MPLANWQYSAANGRKNIFFFLLITDIDTPLAKKKKKMFIWEVPIDFYSCLKLG